MRETACLLVDSDGIVRRANRAALELLGECLGQPCHRVVRLRDAEGCAHCTRACAWFVSELQAAREARGAVRGAIPARVSCSPLGEDVVVVLRPEEEPREKEILPEWLPRSIATAARLPALAVPWRPKAR